MNEVDHLPLEEPFRMMLVWFPDMAQSVCNNHTRAERLAASTYETYELERWVLRKEKASTGITV